MSSAAAVVASRAMSGAAVVAGGSSVVAGCCTDAVVLPAGPAAFQNSLTLPPFRIVVRNFSEKAVMASFLCCSRASCSSCASRLLRCASPILASHCRYCVVMLAGLGSACAACTCTWTLCHALRVAPQDQCMRSGRHPPSLQASSPVARVSLSRTQVGRLCWRHSVQLGAPRA